MSAASPTARIDVFDGLRGIAIILVVWCHATLVTGFRLPPAFLGDAGFLGVELFFFISGFALFYPYARASIEHHAEPTLAEYAARRCSKIIPSYLLALAVFALVYRASFASPGDALTQIFAHVTFLHTLSAGTFGSISSPLWTLGIEVQFYLVFPFICGAFRRRPLLVYGSMVAASMVYRWYASSVGLDQVFYGINQLPEFLDLFGSGMLAAYAYVYLRNRPDFAGTAARRAALSACAFAGSAAFIAIMLEVARYTHGDDMAALYAWLNWHRLLFAPAFLIVALATSFGTSTWRALLTNRALLFFASISYNLYLWHLEIMVWWQRGVALPQAAQFAAGILSALLAATLVTYAFERPAMEFLRHKLRFTHAALGAAKPKWGQTALRPAEASHQT